MLYNSLKDVTWSTTTLPLDRLVSGYRLPQIVKLDCGESVEGLRENDYLLIHSCRQWTTITAHSLEEGHYVIGPKIEIPVHYEGQFKLLEQDRDIKEPVQYFNSVEEVAKAFPERVYVMEEITFNVKMASGESNEDTEVYNITLSTGDELTLMGQAEILYAKTSREKSRFNTIFKRIGKLNSISKLGRGKMPCLICMNHRTNESISLPFQCRGRFSTCSPLELQMQEGEHTIRTIVEKTRLPVNVMVPSSPPRNPHDLHLIREGHRYKLVNIQTKTVVVCCALRSNKILPVHFPLHVSTALPRLLVPEGLLQGEAWLETVVHRWFAYCQEQFDIDDYSRAVRDVRVDWIEDGKSPKKNSAGGTGSGSAICNSSGSGSNGCPSHVHLPSSLSSARDELTQSFHRLSVCVYGNNLHGNSEVNLQGCVSLCGDCGPVEPADADYLFPELLESSSGSLKPDVPYEELWLDHVKNSGPVLDHIEGVRGNSTVSGCTTVLPFSTTGSTSALLGTDVNLPPPPVPPKSEAVKEECRLLNAPPIPPRSSKQASSSSATVPYPPAKPRQTDTRSPSPTLSYYSSGLHNIGGEGESQSESDDQNHACYPCNWIRPDVSEGSKPLPCLNPSVDASFSRLSWPNDFCGGDSYKGEDFQSPHCRSYSSYPRKRTPGTPKACPSGLLDFERRANCEGSEVVSKAQQVSQSAKFCTKSTSYTMEMCRDKSTEECNTKQSQSCPILPPRTPKCNDTKKDAEPAITTTADVDVMELESKSCLLERPHHGTTDVSCPVATGLSWQPPSNLSGISIEEVSKSLRFIGLSDDVVSLFVQEKIDGNLLLQLTEEILSEDFKLSKLQVKKLMQFINGWRPKM